MGMSYFEKAINYTKRDEEIYHKREVEKRTLKSIGDEYGLSAGRVGGIAAKVYRMKLLEKEKGSRWSNPKIMNDIRWTNVRVMNCLYNQNAMELPIKEFIENFNFYKLMRIPNFGKKALQEVCEKLEEHGHKDIEHFRSLKACNRREREKAAAYEIVKAMTL
tara:strand:- start:384 stop:869 length:486 start_codon:yes stop_codon:yes gene_type:complete